MVNEYHSASRLRARPSEQEAPDEVPSKAPASNHGNTSTRDVFTFVGAEPSFQGMRVNCGSSFKGNGNSGLCLFLWQ